MEDLSRKFPHLATSILDNLDNKNLTNCKKCSRDISQFLNTERFYWLRIIKSYKGNWILFQKSWKQAIDKAPVEILKQLAIAIQQFFTPESSRFEKQWPPFWIAIEAGDFQLCKFVSEKSGDISLNGAYGLTSALSLVAKKGYWELCRFILKKINLSICINSWA